MVLGRIIEHVNADSRCKNDSSAHLGFLITSPYPYSYLVFGLYLSNYLKYFDENLSDCKTGQCGVLHARITTLIDFVV